MALRVRTIVRCYLIAVVLIIAIPFVVFQIATFGTFGTGSTEEAIKLRQIVEPIRDPESGEGCDPEYAFKRFDSGEWVLGISRDSHAFMSKYRGGGTFVVKDSRGRVRCFFGHVCGPGAGPRMHETRSLDEFYRGVLTDFTEYTWP